MESPRVEPLTFGASLQDNLTEMLHFALTQINRVLDRESAVTFPAA